MPEVVLKLVCSRVHVEDDILATRESACDTQKNTKISTNMLILDHVSPFICQFI